MTVDIVEDNLSYMRTDAPLLAPIFRSDGQARLLSTLLLTGDELSVTDRAERAALAYPDRESHADRLRRARNQDRYEAKPVGAAATKKAEHVAWTLFDAALGRAI